MKWFRKKDTRLILATLKLFAALQLVVSCQGGGEGVDVVLPDPAAGTVNTCLNCHSNQDKVMALAVDPEALESESEGEG
jgi:hypothetical protein